MLTSPAKPITFTTTAWLVSKLDKGSTLFPQSWPVELNSSSCCDSLSFCHVSDLEPRRVKAEDVRPYKGRTETIYEKVAFTQRRQMGFMGEKGDFTAAS